MSEQQQQAIKCSMSGCSFVCSTPNEWLAHLRSTNHEEEFHVKCCYSDCTEDFKTFAAVKSHVYRKHYGEKKDQSLQSLNHATVTEENTFTLVNEGSDLASDISCLLGLDIHQQKHESALFLMRLREICKLSQASIDEVVIGCQELFNNTMRRVEAGIRQKVAEVGGDMDAFDDVFNGLTDPFTGLETKYLQDKYIKKEFNVLVRYLVTVHVIMNLCRNL